MEKVSELGHLGSAYDQNQGGPRVLGVFFLLLLFCIIFHDTIYSIPGPCSDLSLLWPPSLVCSRESA